MIFIVWADSNDWCGIQSNMYRVDASSEFNAMDVAASTGLLDEEVYEYYTTDEDDEDYIADPSIVVNADEYNEQWHGALENYPKLPL